MLASELKSQIKELWGRFWSGGIANPLSAIEQITYLIFLKRLEDLDNEEAERASLAGETFVSRFANHESCRWSRLKNQDPELMLKTMREDVFPFLKNLKTNGNTFPEAMRDAVFIIPRASLLAGAVDIIDKLPISDRNFDTQGDLYEELLSQLNLAGKNGQFRTPRHIVRVMVELMNPQLGDRVCDPAAGTGGFLVGAYQWILKAHTPSTTVEIDPADGAWHHLTAELMTAEQRAKTDGDCFIGYDFDTTMVRLGLMNMMLHGIRHPQLKYQDTLAKDYTLPKEPFDVVLANPPFTGNIDPKQISDRFTLQTSKTELLFVELCLALLDGGGRSAIIVPEGVLFQKSKAHRELRRRLVEENQLEAVISLPGGCFKPYTGVKTSILVVVKGGTTKRVWFYDVTGDGYSLDDKRERDSSSDDLRFVPQAFRKSVKESKEPWVSPEASEVVARRSWAVSSDEISGPNFVLSASAYRPSSPSEVNFERPDLIVEKMEALEDDIRSVTKRLKALLGETQ